MTTEKKPRAARKPKECTCSRCVKTAKNPKLQAKVKLTVCENRKQERDMANSFVKNVTTAGTQVRLSATDLFVSAVTIRAKKGCINSYVGFLQLCFRENQ